MVLERTTGVNERIYRFNSKCEKREICEFENLFVAVLI